MNFFSKLRDTIEPIIEKSFKNSSFIRSVQYFLISHLGLNWWRLTDKDETRILEQLIKPGMTVVDIGANIGYYSLLFARCVGPHGKVFAFEPDPTNLELLKKNVERSGQNNIIIIPRAVTHCSGKIELYLCQYNPGDHRIFDSHDGRAHISIPSVSLDDYFLNLKSPIDFIKIDVQGAEDSVVCGMSRLLDDSIISEKLSILTEFWPYGLKRMGGDPQTYLKRLEKSGFSIKQLNPDTHQLEPADIPSLIQMKPLKYNYINLLCCRDGGKMNKIF